MPYKDPAVRKAKNLVYSREYRKRHREERNAAARKYHAEHREQIHERKRIYNAAHKAETRARNVAYYRAHKAEMIAMVMKWRAENPEGPGQLRQVSGKGRLQLPPPVLPPRPRLGDARPARPRRRLPFYRR